MIEAATRKQAHGRCSTRVPSARLLPFALAALAASAAATADGARLVEVRVGRHPEFVRVVFETDAPAAFSIEAEGTPGETLVRLDAELAPTVALRAAAGASGAEVLVESLPGGGTLARIRATVPVRVESQVLDEPPRVVLDLRRASAAAESPLEGEEGDEEDATRRESGAPPSTGPDAAREGAQRGAPSDEIEDDGEDAVAALLAELPEPPPPPTPPTPPPPVELPLPPVSGAPPAAIAARFDGRSLVIGAVTGLVLGVALTLLNRSEGRRETRALEPPEEPEAPRDEILPVASRDEEAVASHRAVSREQRAKEPSVETRHGDTASAGTEASSGPSFPAPRDDGESLAGDLLRMIQRLDDRAAQGDALLGGLRERVEQMDRTTHAQAEELASQRLALARLQRALGHPPVRLAADRGKATPASRPAKS